MFKAKNTLTLSNIGLKVKVRIWKYFCFILKVKIILIRSKDSFRLCFRSYWFEKKIPNLSCNSSWASYLMWFERHLTSVFYIGVSKHAWIFLIHQTCSFDFRGNFSKQKSGSQLCYSSKLECLKPNEKVFHFFSSSKTLMLFR